MTTVFVALAWVFSLCLHEFSHAVVAYWGGDTSVRDKGYLTFNPLKYVDPRMSLLYPLIFLFIGGIGLPGGAVWIDRSRLRSRGWETAVSLAGPTANLLLALLLCVPFAFGVRASDEGWFWPAYEFFIVLQLSAALMNLIPVPPLDGFGAISPWLPGNLGSKLLRHSNAGMLAVFLVLSYVPPVSQAFWKGVYGLAGGLGVSADRAWEGYQAFKFW